MERGARAIGGRLAAVLGLLLAAALSGCCSAARTSQGLQYRGEDARACWRRDRRWSRRAASGPHAPRCCGGAADAQDMLPSEEEGMIKVHATPVSLDGGGGEEAGGGGFVAAFGASFGMILVSEIGDETFIIAALMAMRHPRGVVFTGARRLVAVASGGG
eukprot:scaffold1508_cov320-Prasinococcus_capsulatus_cf.AAC.2